MLSEGEKKYSYDSFGRMVRAEVPVESPGTREFQVQINRYDGEGLRHEMEENGRLIKFLYNEDREVVAEETGNGTITRYIRGLGIISSDSEEAKTYYHYVSDEQGSITHVLSEDAEILNHYSYDAFGNIIQKTEKVENRFCYNGEMLDPVTQQYYLRAGFYNPVIGRFTQEDTYYGDGLNLYQYCQANPVGYVDPSGHNCGTTQSRYNSDEEQHPKANAAGGYTSATEKGNSKSGTDSSNPFYKQGGGSDLDDFMSIHAQKHVYNPEVKSTKNKTQFGENIDVAKLREDTLLHPDQVIYDSEHNMIKYVKEYDFNISTPDTPTGSHRVFINLAPRAGKTIRNSQFPYYGGNK